MPTNSNSQRQKNLEKYLRAPDLELIMAFIKELNVTTSQFERFYGFPVGTVRQIKQGTRDLPTKFWHIVYEKIKPMYGAAYYARKKEPKANKSGVATPKQEFPHGNKLLGQLKDKLK